MTMLLTALKSDFHERNFWKAAHRVLLCDSVLTKLISKYNIPYFI